jgi:ketosteroid isomerase-like protein
MFASEAKLPGARLVFEHVIESVGTGVQITHRARVEGPMAWLWAALIRRSIERGLPDGVDRLAKLAGSSVPRGLRPTRRRATMRADENAAILRRAYEAFNTADMNTLTELFDESAVWHLPGRSRFADDYQGREATFAYFGQLGQETGGTFRANLEHVLADDEDRVIGMQRSTAERDGKHLDVANCIVFQLKDGRVVDGREYFHDLYAWDEFWG